MTAMIEPASVPLPVAKTIASDASARAITAVPPSRSGRRPRPSRSLIATIVIPTFTTPTPTAARIDAAEDSTPVNWMIVGA